MYKQIILISLIITSIAGFGQLQHNADTVIPVAYIQETGFDSILIIKGPSPSGFSDTLTITALFPNENTGLIQFYKIIPNEDETSLEQELLLEQNNIAQLSFSTIEQGGYQIRFSNNHIDTTITRWAYFDNLIVNPFYQESCYELFIQGIEGGVTFYYFHPDTVQKTFSLKNGLAIEWKDYYLDEQTQQWVELDSLEFNPDTYTQYFGNPPIDYKTYMFSIFVNDSFGHYDTDSLVYESVAVKADFAASRGEEIIETDSLLSFDAPSYMGFVNKSVNAELYSWYFFNDSTLYSNGGPKYIKQSSFFEPLDSVYYNYPGVYDVKIKVEGRVFIQNGEEITCKDSIRERIYITVYKSFLGELPNVITPGDDGINDRFFFKYIDAWDYTGVDAPGKPYSTTSIKEFKIFIYNRYGLRVHYYEGSDWKGWDGYYNGQVVGTGVYYYLIEASGYDGKTFRKKGFFHVYSSKN